MIIDEKWMLELLDSPNQRLVQLGPDKKAMFVSWINHLIETDFARLCHLLYRVDVDEKQLNKALNSPAAPPAEIIAQLLLERQKQKVALRAKYTRGNSQDIAEQDRW